MDIGGWLRSLGLERRLRQLKGARQRLFSFSGELRLMSSHEDGGNTTRIRTTRANTNTIHPDNCSTCRPSE